MAKNDKPAKDKKAKAAGGKKGKGPSLFPWFCLGFNLALAGGLGYLYWQRPDEWAWLTCIPAWCWLVPGLLLLVPAIGKATWRPALFTLMAWLAFTGFCVEESRSLVRGWLTAARAESTWQQESQSGRAIRVVSLNCSVCNIEAAREAIAQNPDLILLQESPPQAALDTLVKTSFGEAAQMLAGADSSIIVRGKILAITPAPVTRDFVQARVRLARSGQEIEVFGLRLKPPMVKIDVWTAATRREFAEDRRYRRTSIEALADRLRSVPESVPVIMGGDFNVPAGEPCLNGLKPRLRDSFDCAGIGWGNTAIQPIYGHRIDQIWTSQQIEPIRVTAGASKFSDHRMVICDLTLKNDRTRHPAPIAEDNAKKSVTTPEKPLN